MQFIYEYEGERYTVDVSRQADGSLQATINGTSYNVHATALNGAAWLLHIDTERLLAHTAHNGDTRYIQLNGQRFTLEKASTHRRRSRSAAGGDEHTAEMPGQVIDVRVQAGDSVLEGDVLVVLEAMKMEIRVTAAVAGTVSRVLVATGDIVERGQQLVQIESR